MIPCVPPFNGIKVDGEVLEATACSVLVQTSWDRAVFRLKRTRSTQRSVLEKLIFVNKVAENPLALEIRLHDSSSPTPRTWVLVPADASSRVRCSDVRALRRGNVEQNAPSSLLGSASSRDSKVFELRGWDSTRLSGARDNFVDTPLSIILTR